LNNLYIFFVKKILTLLYIFKADIAYVYTNSVDMNVLMLVTSL
jgi:hypothetical protein